MVAGPPPGGRASNNNKNNKNKNENPFTDHPVIPDRVGFSAIQKRIDSIEGENKGADDDKRIDQGKGIRWVTARESGRRATTVPRAFPASSKALYTLPCAVWILLFNQGPQPSAGSSSSSSSLPERALYCLWSHGLNSAVAFVERDGALRYALELKTRGLVTPGPTRVAMTDLQHFCHDRGFGIWMVPADVIPEAPQKVKTDQGFDPHRAAEAEQSRGGAIGEWGEGGQFPQRDQFSPLGFGSGKRGKEEESLLTPEDVRKYRADFERLFAQE